MELTLLIISIAANAVLVVALFFKSALNDIVKEWWIEKRNKAREDRDRLIKLRRHLLTLSQISYGFLSAQAIYHTDDDPVFKEKLKGHIDEYTAKWTKADEFILDIEAYLPQEIRSLYKEYKVKMSKAMMQIIQGPINKEFIVSMYDEIDPCIDKIIDKVDYHLGRTGA